MTVVPPDVLAAAREAFDSRALADAVLAPNDCLDVAGEAPSLAGADAQGPPGQEPSPGLSFGSGREQIWLLRSRKPADLVVGGAEPQRVEVALQYARLGLRLVQRGRLPLCFRSAPPGLATVIVQSLTTPPGRRCRTSWTRV